jgi:hypothetical protein
MNANDSCLNREARGSHLHWYMCSLKWRKTCIREHVVVPQYMTTLCYPIHRCYSCKNLLEMCQHVGLPHTPRCWGYPRSPAYTCKTTFYISEHVGLPHTQRSWGYPTSHSILKN